MTKEQFIEAWLDKYEQNHPDEKLDYEACGNRLIASGMTNRLTTAKKPSMT